MKDYFLNLQNYIVWLNHRIIFVAENVPEEQYLKHIEYHHQSIHGALLHALGGEFVWRSRCTDGKTPSLEEFESNLGNLEALREFWQKEHRAMYDFLKSLNEDDFSKDLEFENAQGEKETFPLIHLLTQNYFHTEQLLTEASMLLTDVGQSPGSIDYLIYYMELGD